MMKDCFYFQGGYSWRVSKRFVGLSFSQMMFDSRHFVTVLPDTAVSMSKEALERMPPLTAIPLSPFN